VALLIVVAFIAGLVTAVSPCVLPILPIVLATGADGDRRRPYLVITGLIASFSFFTLASVSIVQAFHLPSYALRDIAIVIIALFGLTLVVPALSERFGRFAGKMQGIGVRVAHAGDGSGSAISGSGLRSLSSGVWTSPDAQAPAAPRRSVAAGLITGVGLGLVWTPCAGPILGAITSLAVTAPGSVATLFLVVSYSIGAGLPLLAIAMGGRAAISRMHLRSASEWAGRAFGIVVLVTAGLMAVGVDTALSADLTGALPDWTGTLQTIERSSTVQTQLQDVISNANNPNAPADNGQLAPEFTGIDHWLNSAPLTMAGLRGKVVLVDFWTYSCINCIRTLPYVEGWYQRYASDGFVVVGVHSPEFEFEHDTGNVAAAIARFGITYPVAQDNEYGTWTAYTNEYWPADYLIDATGHIRVSHYGEGGYSDMESSIRGLLAEAGKSALPSAASAAPAPVAVANLTPETYIGSDKGYSFASPEFVVTSDKTYTLPSPLPDDSFAVSGTYQFQPEYATASKAGDLLELSFFARDVYLVAAADSPVRATVSVTGTGGAQPTEDVAANGELDIGAARLYHIVHLPAAARGIVTITFGSAGARLYSFTFGG
jgi:cytochrome c biogenesis protein CcdA/thiol-disulfide isomerase/thioredoxin